MSKKSTRPDPDAAMGILRKPLKDLIEMGNLRQKEVKHSLRGGLLLKYRPPDATNVNCRLLAYRLGSEPGLIERRTVRSALETVLKTTPANGAIINESGDVFWYDNFGCYLFTWSPDPAKQQLELFGRVGVG